MRWLCLAIFAIISGCSPEDSSSPRHVVLAQKGSNAASNPFPNAIEVRLFVDNGKYPNGRVGFTKPRGLRLTQEQRDILESTISVKRVEPDRVLSACFIPHHFFQYFDAKGEKLGEIAVCFCCAGISIKPADPSLKIDIDEEYYLEADYARIEKLVQSMKEPTDVECSE